MGFSLTVSSRMYNTNRKRTLSVSTKALPTSPQNKKFDAEDSTLVDA